MVTLGIRPEDFGEGEAARPGADGVVTVTPSRVESLGSELVVYLDLGSVGSQNATARLERRAAVTDGEPIDLSVDLDRLYFFDPESGHAIRMQMNWCLAPIIHLSSTLRIWWGR